MLPDRRHRIMNDDRSARARSNRDDAMMTSSRHGATATRLAPVLVAATLMVGATGCRSDDDTPDEPTEPIDEGDLDQVEDNLEDEADQKEDELDDKEEQLDELDPEL
jgi:hypothetical protein